MFTHGMPSLTIGNHTADIPVIQGGMGVGISLSGLASAVADTGGIGIIAANAIGMIEPDYRVDGKQADIRALRREIRVARKNTSGVIGVNIMVATNDYHELLDTAIDEKVDLVILGAGLPIKGIPVERCRENNVAVVPIVSSARAASLIFRSWLKRYDTVPDAVVVEGPEAGGHLGFKPEQIDDPSCSLDHLLPEVVESVRRFEDKAGRAIPVIAAGGIYSGSDMFSIMRLGASGVQMGTRFVTTDECDADNAFKQAYISCKKNDIRIIESPVGLPGRAIENQFLRDVENGQKKRFTCPWRCLASCKAAKARYCISLALDNARRGNLDEGYAFAGTNAWRTSEIVPVPKLMMTLGSEYALALKDGWKRLNMEYVRRLRKLAGIRREYARAVEQGAAMIRDEVETSRKKLIAMKSDYSTALEKKISSMKKEYVKLCEKGSSVIREEMDNVLHKIDRLSAEYSETKEDTTSIREELSLLFSRYSHAGE